MKRVAVALSTLALLLVAAPVDADPVADATCIGISLVTRNLSELTMALPAGSGPGPECLKACKSGASGCPKAAKARFKCLSQFVKGKAKTVKFYCLADSGEKKVCAANAAAYRDVNLPPYKSAFQMDKEACAASHEACKAKCTP